MKPSNDPQLGWRFSPIRERLVLALSVFLQLVLAYWFGHTYDMRIFMATGYLVATGQNPYVAQDLTNVFNNASFHGMPSIGYPPPVALLLGSIYRIVYAIDPNLYAYNLAIKLPVIIANICLAYLTAYILSEMDEDALTIRKAWIFLLFNPSLLYFGVAWGQFDVMVALFALLGLNFLKDRKSIWAAATLALAISLKPTALPILLVAVVFLLRISWRETFIFLSVFLACMLLFCVSPFAILGWDPTPIIHGWNFHFTVSGGMSLLTFYELLKDTVNIPGKFWLLGLVWIPALLIASWWLKTDLHDMNGLLRKSTGLILVFFLTRAWLSEPNTILILPMVLILTSIGDLKPIAIHAVWVIPLVFTIFNASPPQLLFLHFPDFMVKITDAMEHYRTVRLATRTILVIPWQICGWWIVANCLRERSLLASQQT